MTIFARIFFSLWRIHHLERNGEYLNFLKGDLRGFFFWQSTYVTGSPGKISALYDFFPGSGTFWLQTTVLLCKKQILDFLPNHSFNVFLFWVSFVSVPRDFLRCRLLHPVFHLHSVVHNNSQRSEYIIRV